MRERKRERDAKILEYLFITHAIIYELNYRCIDIWVSKFQYIVTPMCDSCS